MQDHTATTAGLAGLRRYLPFLEWLPGYRFPDFVGDLMAGIIVAVMLIPQSMAYALLAGLPPQVGLYASILPPILYALLGSSRVMAVGPVAMVSLLVATGVSRLKPTSQEEYIALALSLALMVGVIQLAMGLVRVGFIVNFISHAVASGFTSAAALIIAFSQLKHLLGIKVPQTESFGELVSYIATHLAETNVVTLTIGGASIAFLLLLNRPLHAYLIKRGTRETWRMPITRSAPLLVVLLGTLVVWALGLDKGAGVKIVGEIPAGLPPLTWPGLDGDVWGRLLPTALAISFVGFIGSIAVARSLASKRRQKVDANQELVGLGVANLGAAVTGGYPVTGGFARTVVNFAAGANTGLASIITALLIALTVVFLTPLFYYLPQAVLAAVIVVAVCGLIDVATLRRMGHYNRADAASLLITFAAVLVTGIENGILVGAAAAILLYLWRTSKPHTALVGRVGDSEHFRNVLRHQVKTWPHLLLLRIDESLYFANTEYLETQVLNMVAERSEVKCLVLICSAVNFIDAGALETLERLIEELHDAGVTLYLAEVKGPVMDRLQRIGFIDRLGADRVFLSTHQAVEVLTRDGDG